MKRFLFCLLMSFAVGQSIKANHILGGNLTYTCLGNNEYEITLTMYEDCGSSYIAVGTEYVNISNGCGIVISGLTLTNKLFQEEVSTNCSSFDTECNGGVYPGSYKHQWTGIVTLPPCDSWVISFGSCCRGTSSNSNSATAGYSYKVLIDNDQTQCTSSPIFYGENTPIVCVGQDFCLNMGAYDLQGNGIQYSFVSPLTSATTVLAFSPGFSSLTPIPNVTLDSITGVLCGNVSATGNYIFAIKAEVLDSNLNVLNSVIYDLTLEVANCTNAVNFIPNDGNIMNLGSDGFLKDSNTVEMCDDSQLSFDLSFSDANLGDSLSFTSNIQTVLPGAIVTYTYPNAPDFNEINIHVEWASSSPMPGYQFFNFEIKDNSCPFNGVRNYIYKVKMLSALAIRGIVVDDNGLEIGNHVFDDTITICGNQKAQLLAYGGGDYTWTLMSGETINIGLNFGCDTCVITDAYPSITSTYIVESYLSGFCSFNDTITVKVTPDFSSELLPYRDTLCLWNTEEIIPVNVPTSTYSMNITPNNLFSNTGVNYSYEAISPGDINAVLEIQNLYGCIHEEPIHFFVSNYYAPVFDVTSNFITGFCGDTVNLSVDGSPIHNCGVENLVACNSIDTINVGVAVGTNASTSYPAPFTNWYWGARHQYLFTASELASAGLVSGQIKGLMWEVTAVNGTTDYNGFGLRMGCSSLPSFTASFETGLDTVMQPINLVIQNGYNYLMFDFPYSWDGVSNLIIETCFSNTNYSNNSISPWTSTSFNSSLYYRGDNLNVCTQTTGTPSTFRPVTTFIMCSDTNQNSFNSNYLWTSSSSLLSDSLAIETYSVLNETTNFTLTLSDTLTGCVTTDDIQIEILCDTCPTPSYTAIGTSCFGAEDGMVSVTPNGIDGPFNVVVLDPTNLNILFGDTMVTTSSVFNELEAGSYIVRSYDTTGCWSDTVLVMTEPLEVLLSHQSNSFVCLDSIGSIDMFASNAVAPVLYSIDTVNFVNSSLFSNINDGDYFLQAKDANGCLSEVIPISFMDSINPEIEIIQVNETCFYGNGTIQIPSQSIFDSLQYSIDGGQNYSLINYFNNLEAGLYSIVVKDSVGCVTDSNIIVVNTGGIEIEMMYDSLLACSGDDVSISVLSDSVFVSSVWNVDGVQQSGGLSIWNGTFNSLGSHTVHCEVQNAAGCLAEDSVIVLVNDFPTVIVNTSVSSAVVGEDIIFDNLGSNATNYIWYFGDGNQTSSGTANYSYSTQGTFTVVLEGFNGVCTAKDSVQVNIGVLNIDNYFFDDKISVSILSNEVILNFDLKTEEDIVSKIYNLEGRIVKEVELIGVRHGAESINVSDLSDGVYLISLIADEEIIFRKKILKVNQ